MKPPTVLPGRQWTATTIGCAGDSLRHAIDANDALLDAHRLRCHRADALEQRDVQWQVAKLRSQCDGVCRKTGEHDADNKQQKKRADAVPAWRYAVAGVVD